MGRMFKTMYRLMSHLIDPVTGESYLDEQAFGWLTFVSTAQLSQLSNEPGLFLMSGHQRMPQSTLIKIFKGVLKFAIDERDAIILCSTEIHGILQDPTLSKFKFLKGIRDTGCKFYFDIHESGHAGRDGHKITLNQIRPRHILPTHTSAKNYGLYIELAQTFGYEYARTITCMSPEMYYKYVKSKNTFVKKNFDSGLNLVSQGV